MIMHLQALVSHLHLSALLKILPSFLLFFLCLHSVGNSGGVNCGARVPGDTHMLQSGRWQVWSSRSLEVVFCWRVEQRDRNTVAQMHIPCLPRHQWARFIPLKDKLLYLLLFMTADKIRNQHLFHRILRSDCSNSVDSFFYSFLSNIFYVMIYV